MVPTMADEELDDRINAVSKAITIRYVTLFVILILNVLLVSITAAGLGYVQEKLAENPLYSAQTYYQKLSKDSRQLNQDYKKETAEFNIATSLKNISGKEDPTQLLLRDLIFLERDFQDYILHTQLALKDIATHIGGIDEWLFYQQKSLRPYISNSRKRQRALRGLLKKSRNKPLPLKR